MDKQFLLSGAAAHNVPITHAHCTQLHDAEALVQRYAQGLLTDNTIPATSPTATATPTPSHPRVHSLHKQLGLPPAQRGLVWKGEDDPPAFRFKHHYNGSTEIPVRLGKVSVGTSVSYERNLKQHFCGANRIREVKREEITVEDAEQRIADASYECALNTAGERYAVKTKDGAAQYLAQVGVKFACVAPYYSPLDTRYCAIRSGGSGFCNFTADIVRAVLKTDVVVFPANIVEGKTLHSAPFHRTERPCDAEGRSEQTPLPLSISELFHEFSRPARFTICSITKTALAGLLSWMLAFKAEGGVQMSEVNPHISGFRLHWKKQGDTIHITDMLKEGINGAYLPLKEGQYTLALPTAFLCGHAGRFCCDRRTDIDEPLRDIVTSYLAERARCGVTTFALYDDQRVAEGIVFE